MQNIDASEMPVQWSVSWGVAPKRTVRFPPVQTLHMLGCHALRTAGCVPYSACMTSSIIRLFSGGRRFHRFWEELELSLHDACEMELARDESLTQGPLFLRLRERFTLYPIELGRLQSITIHNAQSEFTQGGTVMTGFRASAHVPFSGSKVLLQSQPEAGFQFGFRGKVTKTGLHLHAMLPDLDGREFVSAVETELARISPLLKAFRSTVNAYDDRLCGRIEAKIRTI